MIEIGEAFLFYGDSVRSQLVVLYCGQHLGRLVILFGSEPFADGPGLIEVMQITTQKFDHFVLAQPPCNLFYFFAVITSQRE